VADDDVLVERSFALEPAAASARAAREFIRGLLTEVDREEWLDAAQLAVSEIVSNAVLHAHTRFDVSGRVTRRSFRVEVRDRNPTLPSQRSHDREATTGRGMKLVAAVTSSYGVQPLGPDGKVVWFCIGDQGDRDAEDVLAGWDTDDFDGRPPAEPTVVLLGMPPTLWFAARQHHDALLRELGLYCAEHPDSAPASEDFVLADEARFLISGALEREVTGSHGAGRAPRLPGGLPSPLPETAAEVDLQLAVRPDRAQVFGRLQDLLDEGERLAAADLLLERPALPEIIAVRDWACDQVVAQLGGAPPSRWIGADADRFTVEVHSRLRAEPLGWDPAVVRDADRGAVAADDANRIVAVSRPLAAALGWQVEDLVGRRVVALIPPWLREAHVAAFSRHLSTGEAHILGVPLQLPVLRADGTEVSCDFLLERATPDGGAIFVAWIEPVEQ
jgi:PAS domain S-box-containing protein